MWHLHPTFKPHRGAFAAFPKQNDKCPSNARGDGHAGNWLTHKRPSVRSRGGACVPLFLDRTPPPLISGSKIMSGPRPYLKVWIRHCDQPLFLGEGVIEMGIWFGIFQVVGLSRHTLALYTCSLLNYFCSFKTFGYFYISWGIATSLGPARGSEKGLSNWVWRWR